MDILDYQTKQLFSSTRPLAERMRPKSLNEFVGQKHILGEHALLRLAIKEDKIFSMILWGPPGCGKTSLAKIIAQETKSLFVHFSAVLSGVKDIRAVINEAKENLKFKQKRTILFVDEIHRFNKAQQDAFLHHVEQGLITLIGATTENPSFEIIAPLISRSRVLTLNSLSETDMSAILKNALNDKENGLGKKNVDLDTEALNLLVQIADGDARAALNNLEILYSYVINNVKSLDNEKFIITKDYIFEAFKNIKDINLRYDKSGENHYNLISAFHKSLRGSDPDAALYWLVRMLESGEDPLYIARRMVRFASEDIGNADTNALSLAINAMQSYNFLGSPEGDLALAQAAVYLAVAPKSNSIYAAYKKVKQLIRNTGSLPVPLHIRNAPTKLMKELGYGKDYKYAHDYKNAFVSQNYLPEKIENSIFYNPTERGYEKIIKQRLDKMKALKNR